MKKTNIALSAALLMAGLLTTSCNDWLDLSPIDYYGSGSYWKNEAQVQGYIDGLHSNLRSVAWQHTITFGELRSGIYKDGVSCDGMTTSYGDIRNQNFDADHTGVSNFGNIYGRITNCNLLIARVESADFLDEASRNYYLAIGYGLRAFHYFDLYRNYGGVPLRLGIEVIEGELDPTKLYLERANPSEVMTQIKSDVNRSIELFGDVTDFDPLGRGEKAYWSKAASECLAADIYLWNSKVTIGDQTANESDLAVAKQHLNNVVNNYGLSLLPNFASVCDATNKGNDEIIFAVRYAEGEATNNNGHFLFAITAGQTLASSYTSDGRKWSDESFQTEMQFNMTSNYTMYMEYEKGIFNQYDPEDKRRDATVIGSYRYDENNELYLYGVHCVKNIGYVNTSGSRVFCGDYIMYRLPWAYLALAEIANMEGNNSDVERYINLVRERAYGEDWDAARFGYVAGDFTQNELAILHEKDKEFVQEGQRWYDLLRMTLTKGGDHLVFCEEGLLEGGAFTEPLLDKATEEHKVLWPIDKTLLGNDAALEQTPGY